MSEKVWRNVPPEVIIRDIIESYDLPSAKEAMQNAAENFSKLPSAHDLLRREPVSETPAPIVTIREYGPGRFEIVAKRGARIVLELDVEKDVLIALADALQTKRDELQSEEENS